MRKLILAATIATLTFAFVMIAGCKSEPVKVEELTVEADTTVDADEPEPEPEETYVPEPEYVPEEEYEEEVSEYYDMSEEEARDYIAERESGDDYDAVSPSGEYIGKYQLDKDYLDGDYSPEHQEEVAEEYVQDRYGSWQAAAEHARDYGWY